MTLRVQVEDHSVPASVLPRRGGRLTNLFGRAILGGLGWKISGGMPDLAKAVVIVGPHTSIWDFFVGLATIFALRLKVVFLAKNTLFRWPLGGLMEWLGGVPIDRTSRHNFVARAIDHFQEQDELILGIFPEGTRGKVERWKTGFYYVALGAGVPVVPVYLDFDRRIVGFGEPLEVTGDRTAEFAKLAAHFEGVKGRNPN